MTSEDAPADPAEDLDQGRPPVRVLDTGAVKALAHPIRVAIYDIISQYGPQTASSLAERLGESTGATSYHLRALAKHDLIREVAGRGTARERWWERPAGAVSFAAPGGMPTIAGRAAMQLVMSSLYDRRHQQLMQFVTSGNDTESEQWQDAALISTANVRLTAAQLADVSARIAAVIDETVDRYRDQSGEDVRPVTIRADLFPLAEGDQS